MSFEALGYARLRDFVALPYDIRAHRDRPLSRAAPP